MTNNWDLKVMMSYPSTPALHSLIKANKLNTQASPLALPSYQYVNYPMILSLTADKMHPVLQTLFTMVQKWFYLQEKPLGTSHSRLSWSWVAHISEVQRCPLFQEGQ